jgi:hypothetical protein
MLLALSFSISPQLLSWACVACVLLSLVGLSNALSASMTIWKKRRPKTPGTLVGSKVSLRQRASSLDLSAPVLAAEHKQ